MIEIGPFDGQLSIYLDGEWICGVNPPLLERVLEAIEEIIGAELPRPDTQKGEPTLQWPT